MMPREKESRSTISHSLSLQRTFAFADFLAAMAFVESIAAAAEAQGHHPDILIRYSKVTLTLSTHEAGGLTNKDFALAASIDELC